MKYSWIASSDDGSFEDKGSVWFDTQKEAYADMRYHALMKMKWNTEWEDFSDLDENECIGYNVKFHPNSIVHESYSGKYTYTIVKREESLHGRVWEVLDSFSPNEYAWKVGSFDGVGILWMNNMEGYIVLIEPSGRILKSYI
jgi:hypothetical protein